MARFTPKLLEEGSELPNEVRIELKEAWEANLAEAREHIAAELREEFANRYEHEKEELVEAADNMIQDAIKEHSDKVTTIKERFNKKESNFKRNVKVFEKFVFEKFHGEIKELREDRQAFQNNVSNLDNFVLEQLTSELTEFHGDRRQLVEKRAEIIKEGRAKFEDARKQFVKRAAKLAENFLQSNITKEFKELRSDLLEAKKSRFGRNLFETFATEYGAHFFNTDGETKKLMKALNERENKLDEALEKVSALEETVKKKDREMFFTEDRVKREKTLDDMLSTLPRREKTIMREMLEKTPTNRLTEEFDKMLSYVMEDEDSSNVSKKRMLRETSPVSRHRVLTGNRAVAERSSDPIDEDSIDRIVKLATN